MIFVYGRWWRAGTSLLTRMLDAGGQPAVRDQGCQRWQHAGVVGGGDPTSVLRPLMSGPGVAKVFAPEAAALQRSGLHPAAVIAPTRPWQQSCDSWVGLGNGPLPAEERMLPADRCLRENWERAGVPILTVPFHDLIDYPELTAARIAHHCGLTDHDTEADALARIGRMAACVDPALRHHGAPAHA